MSQGCSFKWKPVMNKCETTLCPLKISCLGEYSGKILTIGFILFWPLNSPKIHSEEPIISHSLTLTQIYEGAYQKYGKHYKICYTDQEY